MKLLSAILLVAVSANAQAPQGSQISPQTSAFYLRDFARLAGNFGGWWGLLTDNEKGAFLTGYQSAMQQIYISSYALCQVVKNKVAPSTDSHAFDNEVSVAIGVCLAAGDFDGFSSIVVKDVDGFYAIRLNQAIRIEWALSYLRDKAAKKKTEGQLLDELNSEQKDMHDCSKYAHLCKLGTE